MQDQYGLMNIDGLGCYLGEGQVPMQATVDALIEAEYKGSFVAEIMLFGKPKMWEPDVPSRTSRTMNDLLKDKYLELDMYKPLADRKSV